MKCLMSLVLACLSLTACGGGGSMAPAIAPPVGPSAAPPASSTAAIDAVIAQNYPNSIGVELGIYRNGSALYIHGYGLRDRGLPEQFVPWPDMWHVQQPDQLYGLQRGAFAPDANTEFHLGSVSKQFTAGAILLLEQDGKLGVGQTLATYFPTFTNGASVTIQELLQHTSGIVEYNNFGSAPDFTDAYAQFMASGQTSYQPIVDQLNAFPLMFAPASAYNYSNTDYALLGMIVAKLSGMPLGAFLQQRIFGPLGMTQTYQGLPPPPVSDFALGYRNDGQGFRRTWQWNLQWLAGPGGLISTVGDLEKWDLATRKPGIFTQSSLAQMVRTNSFPQAYGTYAYGWIVGTLNGHRYVWHDGEIGGYQTTNATFPDDNLDIIVLTNAGVGGLDPYYIMPQLLPLALTMK